jgi:hypothetical protein
MDAAVQGSTGGKRFAMKAQRPVRDGQGNHAAGDLAMGEDSSGGLTQRRWLARIKLTSLFLQSRPLDTTQRVPLPPHQPLQNRLSTRPVQGCAPT